MNEETTFLQLLQLGEEHFQKAGRMYKRKEKKEFEEDSIPIGKIYIHQMTIKRDIKDRFEPVYSIKYDDLIFDETKTIENKTFDDLVNFIDKQKLIYEPKNIIEDILLYNIVYNHGPVNGIDFIVKEIVDFEDEMLPMNRI